MPHRSRFLLAGLAASALLGACKGLPPSEQAQAPVAEAAPLSEWGARLAGDAQALHDGLDRNHPGAADPLNPGFARTNSEALARALSHAPQATDAAGWWWALREYAAAFDDAHLDVYLESDTVSFQQTWAGFLTRYQAGDFVVAARDETLAGLPPMGARLVACDGASAEAFAASRVGRFRGRWTMESQKITHAPWLFRDSGNPWAARPQTCTFDGPDGAADYAINWYPLTLEEVGQRLDQVRPPLRMEVSLKLVERGGYWISLPDFTGNPDSTLYPHLSALMDELAAKQAALRAAPFVVLDVRDNGGGSSRWSQIVGETLWGADWIAAHPVPESTSVDWRASEENLAELEPYVAQFREMGDPVMINWIERVVSGLAAARAEGDAFWIDAGEGAGEPVPLSADAVSQMTGKVFVLTDAACFSACLDAVDLWKAAGAVQAGQVTGGDTVYIENRSVTLPSGLAGYAQSMKVYRGRHRGNNEPHVPAHVFGGDIGDDAAVISWVSALAAE
ncbi:MAG: peptidase S41 [Hyphomonas sp.]